MQNLPKTSIVISLSFQRNNTQISIQKATIQEYDCIFCFIITNVLSYDGYFSRGLVDSFVSPLMFKVHTGVCQVDRNTKLDFSSIKVAFTHLFSIVNEMPYTFIFVQIFFLNEIKRKKKNEGIVAYLYSLCTDLFNRILT